MHTAHPFQVQISPFTGSSCPCSTRNLLPPAVVDFRKGIPRSKVAYSWGPGVQECMASSDWHPLSLAGNIFQLPVFWKSVKLRKDVPEFLLCRLWSGTLNEVVEYLQFNPERWNLVLSKEYAVVGDYIKYNYLFLSQNSPC